MAMDLGTSRVSSWAAEDEAKTALNSKFSVESHLYYLLMVLPDALNHRPSHGAEMCFNIKASP